MNAKPQATAISSARNAWRQAFPKTMDEATRAVSFLAKTWQDVVLAKPKRFHPSERENKHTELFAKYLQINSTANARLTGFWVPEQPDVILQNADSDEPQVVARIRKDISYLSNQHEPRLMLIFEFKKLKNSKSSWNTYCGPEGMGRFVYGNYAAGLPNAVMVGMVIGEAESCVHGLKLSLQSRARREDLRMLTQGDERVILEPSIIFPNIVSFDTEHQRPPDKAPPHGSIMLSHLFLQMPPEASSS